MIFIAIVVAASIALLIFGISTSTEQLQKDNIPYQSLSKVKYGLSLSDSLRNANLTHHQLFEEWNNPYADPIWTLFGDAPARKAPINVSENTIEGLSLGIKSPVRAKWVGYFAISRDDYASLYHVVLTLPNKVLPIWSFSTGMYIQTDTTVGKINYVDCVGDATPLGVVWSVHSGIGNATDVTQHFTLWNSTEKSTAETASRDCTIITNGDNYLKVYLDGNMVYSNNTLNLQMPRPFNSYLEVQTTMDNMLYGRFKDYYSTKDENIKVINTPIGGVVKIVDASSPSKVLAEAPVDEHGVANLDIGKYHFPLNAQIQVYSVDKIVASTAPNTRLYGGDVYSSAKS